MSTRFFFFFFNDTATTEIYTLSLHDALPILRKPGKLPEFASLHSAILDAYQRWSPPDPALGRRVAWYEQATLMGKIHVLAFDLTRHPEADARRQRQVEAVELLQCLPSARDSDRSS